MGALGVLYLEIDRDFKTVETKGCSAMLCLGTDLASNVVTLTASSKLCSRPCTTVSVFYFLEITLTS